tara:strand:+ start:2202 stop:2945 length:744 start_codon:yes stop_codon:yes gene_type:complete
MIVEHSHNNIKESVIRFDKKTRKWLYDNPKDQGKPAFERCVENCWILEKIASIDEDISGCKLVDFGCNKAEYIKILKSSYSLRTYGMDMKKLGSKYVDRFFCGEYNDSIEKKFIKNGPYKIATAISAIEHAGNKMHPDEGSIRKYQCRICKNLIRNSDYFFITVPFGKRPGWAKDKSRKNLYQFDEKMLDYMRKMSKKDGKEYLEEIYKLDGGFWVKSSRDKTRRCIYRGKKQGATAIAMVSVWRNP